MRKVIKEGAIVIRAAPSDLDDCQSLEVREIAAPAERSIGLILKPNASLESSGAYGTTQQTVCWEVKVPSVLLCDLWSARHYGEKMCGRDSMSVKDMRVRKSRFMTLSAVGHMYGVRLSYVDIRSRHVVSRRVCERRSYVRHVVVLDRKRVVEKKTDRVFLFTSLYSSYAATRLGTWWCGGGATSVRWCLGTLNSVWGTSDTSGIHHYHTSLQAQQDEQVVSRMFVLLTELSLAMENAQGDNHEPSRDQRIKQVGVGMMMDQQRSNERRSWTVQHESTQHFVRSAVRLEYGGRPLRSSDNEGMSTI
ncbi:hypothetical protein Tco_0502699 [Tanacetum coccineum]